MIEWPEARKVIIEVVKNSLDRFADVARFNLCGAGSPCQDLSSLNFWGYGLTGARSSLVCEVSRIDNEIIALCDLRLMWFIENISSMTIHSIQEISALLGVKSYST